MEIAGHERREGVDAGTGAGAAVSDDQQRFAGLFEGCRPHLMKLCQRILGQSDRAADAVSETYLRAHEKREDFDGRNFPGWLSRIAQHICLDRLRKEFREQSLSVEIERTSADSEVRFLTALQIRSILAELPEEQRRCLKLFYIEGLTTIEVAKASGYTEKQVKSYLQNGRRNFIRAWESLEYKSHA